MVEKKQEGGRTPGKIGLNEHVNAMKSVTSIGGQEMLSPSSDG